MAERELSKGFFYESNSLAIALIDQLNPMVMKGVGFPEGMDIWERLLIVERALCVVLGTFAISHAKISPNYDETMMSIVEAFTLELKRLEVVVDK
jgi:hypothetical protein